MKNSTTTQTELPQFLRDLLSAPPTHGNGVHGWLFKVARQLHAHRDEQAIVDLLAAATDGCGRHVPESEIRAAVESARACAWQPTGQTGRVPAPTAPPKWPTVDASRRAELITQSGLGLADLFDMSPTRLEGEEPDAEWFIDELFPGNPLLCIGYSMRVFTTEPRESFRGDLREMSLIVPSPMISPVGIRKSDGKLSAHTLANTGPRHYLVTEFDSGTSDEQAAIIHHLSGFAPLAMVLSSGGKSLHAWFNCRGSDDIKQKRFFRYAVTLGADPATWTRSQFVRLPMGWRHDKARRQEVFYFNHNLAGEGKAR